MPACCSCGREEIPLFDVGCANPDIKACRRCIFKYGKAALKVAADQALEFLLSPAGKTLFKSGIEKCGHCPGVVFVQPDGRVPLFCSNCERDYRRIVENPRAVTYV